MPGALMWGWMLLACRGWMVAGLPSQNEVLESATFAAEDLLNQPVKLDPPLCASAGGEVDVQVVGPDGMPVKGATIGHKARGSAPLLYDGETDAAGRLHLRLAAGQAVAPFALAAPSYQCVTGGEPALFQLDSEEIREIAAASAPPEVLPTEIHGVVRTSKGGPAAGVRVQLIPSDPKRHSFRGKAQTVITDSEGRYAATFYAPDRALTIATTWEERGDLIETIQVEPGQSIGYDLKLGGGHRVQVRCAGYPDDSCASMLRPSCGGLESGIEVVDGVKQTWTYCPNRESVVYSGSTAVRIRATDTVAWLDYRGWKSSVAGTLGGAGKDCRVLLVRDNYDMLLFHLPFDEFSIPAQKNGHFQSGPVPPGPYAVNVGCGSEIPRAVKQIVLKDEPLVLQLDGV